MTRGLFIQYQGERHGLDPSRRCIDCVMGEPEGPIEAIFFEDELPEEWSEH